MHLKGWAITAGIGAAAGAVAVLMMPRTNPTRRLAAKAANKVEDVAWKGGKGIPPPAFRRTLSRESARADSNGYCLQ